MHINMLVIFWNKTVYYIGAELTRQETPPSNYEGDLGSRVVAKNFLFVFLIN